MSINIRKSKAILNSWKIMFPIIKSNGSYLNNSNFEVVHKGLSSLQLNCLPHWIFFICNCLSLWAFISSMFYTYLLYFWLSQKNYLIQNVQKYHYSKYSNLNFGRKKQGLQHSKQGSLKNLTINRLECFNIKKRILKKIKYSYFWPHSAVALTLKGSILALLLVL